MRAHPLPTHPVIYYDQTPLLDDEFDIFDIAPSYRNTDKVQEMLAGNNADLHHLPDETDTETV